MFLDCVRKLEHLVQIHTGRDYANSSQKCLMHWSNPGHFYCAVTLPVTYPLYWTMWACNADTQIPVYMGFGSALQSTGLCIFVPGYIWIWLHILYLRGNLNQGTTPQRNDMGFELQHYQLRQCATKMN